MGFYLNIGFSLDKYGTFPVLLLEPLLYYSDMSTSSVRNTDINQKQATGTIRAHLMINHPTAKPNMSCFYSPEFSKSDKAARQRDNMS